MIIRNEKAFSNKLRRELKKEGIETVISEVISKGFPDLMLIDTAQPGIYFLELKYSLSKNPEVHSKIIEPMQKHWLNKLNNAYAVVYVPGEDLCLHFFPNISKDEVSFRFESTKDLVRFLRS